MNIIELTGWYAQPVHCPFCGEALGPHEPPSCKHLLYVIFDGNFQFRSQRFEEAANFTRKQNEFGPELSIDDINKFGTVEEIVHKASKEFPNLTEFQVDNVSDIAYIGFSNHEAETCGWGLDHTSPYVK